MELIYLLVGLVLLVFGGDYLVKGASGLALRLNISPMLVGITIVSLGTSAPELLVSVSAALKGKPDIAMGNVVGSNIANVALILGITALIFPIAIRKRTLQFDWVVMMLAGISVYLFGMDGQLGPVEGIIFLIFLALYIFYSYYREAKKGKDAPDGLGIDTKAKERPLAVLLLIVVAGSVALVFGANLLVEGAESIARNFGVSDRVIAITLVAFGTSLPELAASVIAAFKGEKDISLGNIIGSNIYNLLAILGVSSVIAPLQVSQQIIDVDIWWMLATSAAVLPIGIISMRIGRVGGCLLFFAYVFYIYLVLVSA
jgi:cation:H+ antiporter